MEQYAAVLLAIAGGSTAHKAISERAGIGERSLHYYLRQLLELGYLIRRYPLTGTGAAARHVRYAVGDPLLRFWFRFIFPRLSQVIRLGPQAAFQRCVAPDLDAYFGRCFESLSREALAVLYQREGVAANFEIGEYWDKTTQIDVVGLRQDGWTDLGECKWGEDAGPGQIVAELLQRVPCYPNTRNATIAPRVFTRRPVMDTQRRKHAGVRFHSLEELYGDAPRRRRR
jgi:AAA+ ATPase superfamily predicted ATPase